MNDTKTKTEKSVDIYPEISESVLQLAVKLERLRKVNPDQFRHWKALILEAR